MITLYGTPTSPNVLKVRAMLEESGIPYREQRVKREEGENRSEAFLQISAAGTMPAMVDEETGARVFESSAILLYLGDRFNQFLPAEPSARADVYKWLLYEAANIGPAIENMYKLMYLGDEWTEEAIRVQRERLLGAIELLEQQLGVADYIAGECSIADFALFPLAKILEDFLERPLTDFPNLNRWCERMLQRDGVKRALATPQPG